MSDHGHGAQADESGRNRTYLSLFVVVVGIALAAGWATRAAPHGPGAPDLGGTGVVVCDEGPGRQATVLRGTLLVRGDRIVVIAKGRETQVPRTHVRWFDTQSSELSSAYFERWPVESHPLSAKELARRSRDAAPVGDEAPARVGGTVVLRNGEVFVGWLEETPTHLVVSWPYKQLQRHGELRLPRRDVRWHRAGVDQPTADYWQAFPDAPIDSRYPAPKQHQASSDPELVKAELAQQQGKFEEGAGRWAQLYVQRGFQEAHFTNLKTCLSKWQKTLFQPNDLQRSVELLETRFAGHLDRGEVRGLLAQTTLNAARTCQRNRLWDAARSFAQKAVDLGGPYRAQGEGLLREVPGGR